MGNSAKRGVAFKPVDAFCRFSYADDAASLINHARRPQKDGRL